jgi:hypothetical protein
MSRPPLFHPSSTADDVRRMDAALDWDLLAMFGIQGPRTIGGLFPEADTINWSRLFYPTLWGNTPVPAPQPVPFLFRVAEAGPMALAHVIRVGKETGCPLDFNLMWTLERRESRGVNGPWPAGEISLLEWAVRLVPSGAFLTPEGHRLPHLGGHEGFRDALQVDEAVAGNGGIEVVRLLLAANARPTPEVCGWLPEKTSLVWSVFEETGFEWQKSPGLGQTMRRALARWSNPEFESRCRFLLERGVGFDESPPSSRSAFLDLMGKDPDFLYSEAVSLWKLGADLHAVTGEPWGNQPAGQNAFHVAMEPFFCNSPPHNMDEYWTYQLARKLIWLARRGVDPNLPDDAGQTLWHLVCQSPLPALFGKILDRAGAQWDIPDHKGQTPLDIAVSRGSEELEWFLRGKMAIREQEDLTLLLPLPEDPRLQDEQGVPERHWPSRPPAGNPAPASRRL